MHASPQCSVTPDDGGRGDVPRYRLVSRIATGGMSEVFLALMAGSCGTPKPVVIKRLWRELAGQPEYVELFLEEARVTLQMQHRNVVHAYEAGQHGGRHYLALEYLDGQSLKHLVDGVGTQGVSLPLALHIICEVLAALEYVHSVEDLTGRRLSIVHRDVSPQNVFITYEGGVKLVDFGIAQSIDTPAERPARDVKGRIAYMAPEQLAGEVVDRRADLFAVGVMLWELVTGRRLWQGMNEAGIAEHLVARRPLPRLSGRRGLPPGLGTICARALAPDREERYPDASAFLSELGDLFTGSAPVQARLLGDLMSQTFASTRALRRTMIQQALGEPSNENGVREESGGPPADGMEGSSPDLGVVFDRSTSSAIAVPGEDVTQTRPVRRPVENRRPKRLYATLGAAFLLAGLASGVAVTGVLDRPGARAGAVVMPAAVVEAPVATPPARPAPPAVVTEPPLPAARPTLVVEATASIAPPVASRRSVGTRARPARREASRETAEPAVPAVREIEVQVRAMRRAPGRAIDRDDPYGER